MGQKLKNTWGIRQADSSRPPLLKLHSSSHPWQGRSVSSPGATSVTSARCLMVIPETCLQVTFHICKDGTGVLKMLLGLGEW